MNLRAEKKLGAFSNSFRDNIGIALLALHLRRTRRRQWAGPRNVFTGVTRQRESMKRRILLIANPAAAAGRASDRWQELLAASLERGLSVEHAITSRAGHAMELAKAAAGKFDVLVAVGGDGTVNEVANGILLADANETALAVVPFGTGNDVAQWMGIRSLESAIQVLEQGHVRRIDAIEVIE